MKIYRIAAPIGASIDWSKVDWSKSDRRIASELGIGKNTVNKYRVINAPQEFQAKPKIRIWNQVDWTKSNKEIALELGATPSAVAHARKFHAPDTIKNNAENIDWSKVDWSKRNVDIATEMNISQSAVSAMRGFLAPDTVKEPTTPARIDWTGLDWEHKTNGQIEEQIKQIFILKGQDLPFSLYSLPIYISRNRHRYAPLTVNKKYEQVLQQPAEVVAQAFNWYRIAVMNPSADEAATNLYKQYVEKVQEATAKSNIRQIFINTIKTSFNLDISPIINQDGSYGLNIIVLFQFEYKRLPSEVVQIVQAEKVNKALSKEVKKVCGIMPNITFKCPA